MPDTAAAASSHSAHNIKTGQQRSKQLTASPCTASRYACDAMFDVFDDDDCWIGV